MPFFRGRSSDVESSRGASRQENQRAVEDGIEQVRQAIRQLLSKPKDERDAHLRMLAAHLESLAKRLGSTDVGDGARRIRAAHKVVGILRRASDAKP